MEHQFDMINNQSEVVPIIQNVVSTVDLGCKLNLSSIVLKAMNAEYNPKRLTAVVMRIREPKTTALIFSSGKIVCAGAKTVEDSKLAARKYARIVQKLGFPVKFLDFKIRNIVGSCDIKCLINLETLMLKNAKYSVYEPELFPGLVYKMISPCVTILVFTSGKIVIAGAKTVEDSKLAARKYARIVQKLGFPVKFLDFKIRNIVGSCDIKCLINLETLMLKNAKYSVYEPELFPGLVYKMISPCVTILVFTSGKIVIAGAKKKEDVFQAFQNIYPVLQEVKRKVPNRN